MPISIVFTCVCMQTCSDYCLTRTHFPDDACGDRVSRVLRRGRRAIVGGPTTVRE